MARDPTGGRHVGRPPRLDLPRGRRGAGLRAGRARGPRRQAEPAPRRRPRPGRRRSRPGTRSDRLDPQRRWRGPRHRPGHDPGRPGGLDRRDAPSLRPTTSGATSTSPGGWSAASRPTPSCSCATAGSSGSGPGRRRGSTRPAAPSPRPWPTPGPAGAAGAACASDAFYPFADAVEVCLDGGRHRVRAAGRLGPRRRGRGGGGCGRGDDGHDGHAALPPLMAGSVATRPAVLIRPWHTPMTGRDPAETHRASTPLELLFDLCFVVAVSRGARDRSTTTWSAGQIGHGLVNYLVVFFAIWWPWMNFTWFASAYDTDDVQYRLLTFVQIAGVLVVAAGGPGGVRRARTSRSMVIGYVSCASRSSRSGCGPPARIRSAVPVALRFAIGIALIQVGWVVRLLIGWSEVGYLTFLVLGILELAVPAWAERAGRRHAVARRPHRRALRPVHDHRPGRVRAGDDDRGRRRPSRPAALLLPLLTVAVGGLLLVFAMWWSYFKHEPDVGHHRSLRSMLGWGYGHYFVFAAVGRPRRRAGGRRGHDRRRGRPRRRPSQRRPWRCPSRSTWSRSLSSMPGACRRTRASWRSSSP